MKLAMVRSKLSRKWMDYNGVKLKWSRSLKFDLYRCVSMMLRETTWDHGLSCSSHPHFDGRWKETEPVPSTIITIRMRQWFWFSTERQKLPCQFPVEKSASKPRLWQKQKPKPFATVRPLDPQRHPPLAEWGKPHEPSPLRWSSMPLFGMFVDAWWIHTVASDVSAFLPPSPEPASLVQQVLPPVGVKKPRGALEKTTAETAHRDSHGPKTLLRSWLFGSLWIESNFWSFKVCCGIDDPFMDYHGLPIKTDSFL